MNAGRLGCPLGESDIDALRLCVDGLRHVCKRLSMQVMDEPLTLGHMHFTAIQLPPSDRTDGCRQLIPITGTGADLLFP